MFYLNLPLGGLAIAVTHLFLNLQWNRKELTMAKLRRIDYIGNAILIAASVSILIALTWAGPVYPWSDARVLTPLIFGLVGLVGFVIYEGSGFPSEPVMPIRLFPNRTSRIVYVNTFLNMVLIFWCYFFLRLYFQAVKMSTPSRSGVQMLPVALIAIPGAALSAFMLSKWGKIQGASHSLVVLRFLKKTAPMQLGFSSSSSPPSALVSCSTRCSLPSKPRRMRSTRPQRRGLGPSCVLLVRSGALPSQGPCSTPTRSSMRT